MSFNSLDIRLIYPGDARERLTLSLAPDGSELILKKIQILGIYGQRQLKLATLTTFQRR